MSLGLTDSTDLVKVLGDPTRLRLLALLAVEALSVAELTRVTRLAQSRVSTHLARLKEARLVRDRRQGNATFYESDLESLPEETRRLVGTLLGATRDPLLEEDQARLAATLRERAGRGSASWADSVAGSMDRHYSPGRTWEATAWGILGLARLGHVLDVASGDGVLAELLAQRARSVTCLEKSGRVSEAGKRRVRGRRGRVHYCRGDMHALPFGAACFDQALLMNALTYAEDPARVVGELARVLKPGATLVAVTLNRHAHRDSVARFDHVQLGFTPVQLSRSFAAAGFRVDLCEVTTRERRRPHFEVITVHAEREARAGARPRLREERTA